MLDTVFRGGLVVDGGFPNPRGAFWVSGDGRLQERGDLIMLSRLVRPEDHALMVQDPYFMFGSDMSVTAPDAVKVKGVGGITDQRLYGEAIEVLAGPGPRPWRTDPGAGSS